MLLDTEINQDTPISSQWQPRFQLSMPKYAHSQFLAISARPVSSPIALVPSDLRKRYSGMRTDAYLRVDFWGPASNFGIPIAAVMDTKKDPEM